MLQPNYLNSDIYYEADSNVKNKGLCITNIRHYDAK